MNALCHAVMRYFAADTPLVLATMMDQKGSVPRTAGARMLVLPDGSIWGTVGGGRYEAESIAVALVLHRQGVAWPDGQNRPRPGAVLEYYLTGVTDMDMICGGALILLLEYLPPCEALRQVYAVGKEAERAGLSFGFITRFFRGKEAIPADMSDSLGETLRHGNGKYWTADVERFATPATGAGGMFAQQHADFAASLPGDVIHAALAHKKLAPHHIKIEDAEYLLEHVPGPYRIAVFGGGHVSQAVAALAHAVDFHVTIVDDRSEFANTARFPNAQVKQLASLGEKDCAAFLVDMKITATDGLVIVTRGHSHDREALAAALSSDAGYIGMIGSKSKRVAVYASLRESGVEQERLDAVHSPIGLDIGAETPQEIAVSIVAELIQWRQRSRAQREIPSFPL